MTLPYSLLGIVVLALIVALPLWSFSRGWGWFPSGAIAFVLMVLLVTDLFSHIFV